MDKHNFAIGNKVYANLEHNNFFGTRTYKGVVTICDCEFDENGTPVYSVIKTSMTTYNCTLQLYRLDHHAARFLGICGYENEITEDKLMSIPQKSEYTKDELAVFQIAYENRNNASFVKSETDVEMIDDDMIYYRKAMKFK